MRSNLYALFSLESHGVESIIVNKVANNNEHYDKRKHDLINAKRGLETITDSLQTINKLDQQQIAEIQNRMQEVVELVNEELTFWLQIYSSDRDD